MERHDVYDLFRPLNVSLLQQYGHSPELRQDLPGEIYYQLQRVLDSYDLAQGGSLSAHVTERLSRQISLYVRDYWQVDSYGFPTADLTSATLYVDTYLSLPVPAIAALPHRQRLALVWRYYENRGEQQIALDLGVQPLEVQRLLRHALASLRNHAARQSGDEVKRHTSAARELPI
jgi:DNA-directed RNA polymerase specialized sigma24 family protein